jgi:hypothetical protein
MHGWVLCVLRSRPLIHKGRTDTRSAFPRCSDDGDSAACAYLTYLPTSLGAGFCNRLISVVDCGEQPRGFRNSGPVRLLMGFKIPFICMYIGPVDAGGSTYPSIESLQLHQGPWQLGNRSFQPQGFDMARCNPEHVLYVYMWLAMAF